MEAMLRVTIRVRPGAARPGVGGAYGAEDPPTLLVSMAARPVDGAANEAVVSAVAKAFGLRPRQVVLVSGQRSRTKVLDLDIDPQSGHAQLAQLLAVS